MVPRPEGRLTSVMESLLSSSTHQLPPCELTTACLTECLTFLGAGSVTTAQTLTTAISFVLASPTIHFRLQTELADLYATNENPTCSQLSQLPYLTAVLREALRLSYGGSSRLPRIAPDMDLTLPDGRMIPRGTPVSMTQTFLHDDSILFPKPLEFLPERWLHESNDIVQGGSTSMQASRKYFVPFSRGTRAYLGTNLAWAELYMCLAGLLRPVECGGVDLELFETIDDEVRVEHDYFNPAPAKGAKGMRVLVK
jgi:cytochrome P450